MRFVDEYKQEFGGVEPICRVLREHGCQIAPSIYWAAKSRPASARQVRDEQLLVEARRIHADNYGVYGARKVWCQLRREGHRVARCTVERLMRQAGLAGAVRGKNVRTTVTGPAGQRAGDRVNRDFTAARPNRTWCADFTYVAAWCGIVYVAFVVDVFSRAIVGTRPHPDATTTRSKNVKKYLDRAAPAEGAPAGRLTVGRTPSSMFPAEILCHCSACTSCSLVFRLTPIT